MRRDPAAWNDFVTRRPRAATSKQPAPGRAQARRAASPRTEVAAPAALARVARRLGATNPRSREAAARADRGPLDVTGSPRSVALELIAGRGHYERVIRAVLAAHTSVWIATANVKERR